MPDFQTHGDIFAQNRCFSLKSWVAACCTMLHVGLGMSESRNRNLGQLVSFSDSVVFPENVHSNVTFRTFGLGRTWYLFGSPQIYKRHNHLLYNFTTYCSIHTYTYIYIFIYIYTYAQRLGFAQAL